VRALLTLKGSTCGGDLTMPPRPSAKARGVSDSSEFSTSVDTEVLYGVMSSALLGQNGCILSCQTGRFKGRPLLVVLLRAIFVVIAGRSELPVAPDWTSSAIGNPPTIGSDHDPSSSVLCSNTYNDWYVRVGVRDGEIGSGNNIVKVTDKDKVPCGVETVRLVVRKSLLQDVPRAFAFAMVFLKRWRVDGGLGLDEMQSFKGTGRRQGMVQVFSRLLVNNIEVVIQMLSRHFAEFPLESQVVFTALIEDVRCTVQQPPLAFGRKRQRPGLVKPDLLDELVNEMVRLWTLLKQLRDESADENSDTNTTPHSQIVGAVRLHLEVKAFLERVLKAKKNLEGAHLDALREFANLKHPEDCFGQCSAGLALLTNFAVTTFANGPADSACTTGTNVRLSSRC